MARVTYGSGVTELAGSIGGVTFQKNASGNIAKLRANPVVNPTALQAGYQTNMATLVAFWPTLSQANKDLWDALAAAHDHTTPWGETKTLSGYQWFLSCNLVRKHKQDIPLSAPLAWTAPAPPPAFTIEVAAGYIRAAWAAPYDPVFSLLAYCTLPLRQSSLKLRRSLFFIKIYYDCPGISTWDLTTEIESLFNVTWGDFFASANCSIIMRIIHSHVNFGYNSAFTSAIIKI